MRSQQRCRPLCEWCSPLLIALANDGDGEGIPVNIVCLDTRQFAEPHATVSEETDNALVSWVIQSIDESIHLLLSDTG